MAKERTASIVIRNEDGKEMVVVIGSNKEIDFYLGEAGLCSKEEEKFLQL